MIVKPDGRQASDSMTIRPGSLVPAGDLAHSSFGQANAWPVTSGPR